MDLQLGTMQLLDIGGRLLQTHTCKYRHTHVWIWSTEASGLHYMVEFCREMFN